MQDNKPVSKLQSFLGIESERESPFEERGHDRTVLSPQVKECGIDLSPIGEEGGIDFSPVGEEGSRIAIPNKNVASSISGKRYWALAENMGCDILMDGPEIGRLETQQA